MAKKIKLKVVRAVQAVTRESVHPNYAKHLINKRSAKNRDYRKDRAKSLKDWRKRMPSTVRGIVKDKMQSSYT